MLANIAMEKKKKNKTKNLTYMEENNKREEKTELKTSQVKSSIINNDKVISIHSWASLCVHSLSLITCT